MKKLISFFSFYFCLLEVFMEKLLSNQNLFAKQSTCSKWTIESCDTFLINMFVKFKKKKIQS